MRMAWSSLWAIISTPISCGRDMLIPTAGPPGFTIIRCHTPAHPFFQQYLQYVVDPDGLTNTLTYQTNNTAQTLQLIAVTNAYGLSAHFQYDANFNLTNITDAQGMSSAITYDTNGYPDQPDHPLRHDHLSTCSISISLDYGTNLTEGTFGGHNMIDRAALVTDAGGATHAYAYRYDCSAFMATSFASGNVPTGTPLGTLDDGTTDTSNGLSGVDMRNSFAWEPRQFAGVLTNDSNISAANVLSLTNLTASDYLRGRMRHWLQDTNELQVNVSGSLSVEQAPSPDGSTTGLLTFYD